MPRITKPTIEGYRYVSRKNCRGDAVHRPGASVHPGPIVYQRGDRTCTAPRRATHRVAPTLPAGRVWSVE
jgi:hypothetical protein